MKNIKLILLFAVFCFTSACEDFLTEKPTGFINPATFFKTEADAQAAVIAGYDFYGGSNTLTFGAYQDFTYEALTDDFKCRPLGNENGLRDLSLYTSFKSTAPQFSLAYANHFRGINTFNVAIDGISGMSNFTNQKALIAEAKYLRAYGYFILVRLFGPVPLLKSSLSAEEVRSIPRAASVDEVYELIISDLQTGVAELWEKAPAPGRATKWAAMALLSNVYLNRKSWKEAVSLATRVIKESPHKLLPVFKDVFSDKNENNAESIFEFQMSIGDERANQVGNWPTGTGPKGDKDYFLGPNWGGLYIATDDMISSFEPGDKRRELISTSVTRNNGTYIEFSADGDVPNFPLKRVSTSYIEGIEANNNSGYNYIALRLAEVYLFAAEAENEANGPGDAYQFINPVRLRAGLGPLVGLNQIQFREAVRNERRHELYDERKRYFDLLRWDILIPRTLAVKPNAIIKDYHKIWPVPQDAIDRNPALAGHQNPGY